jgi:hypothetical protein
MPFDYDVFRKQPWDERISFFNELSAAEKAKLVRTHISRWLQEHREELTPAQIEMIQANIAFVTPELYVVPAGGEMLEALKQLERRNAEVLSREQIRSALTMHW